MRNLKKGDKVKFVDYADDIWGDWSKGDGFKPGKVYTVHKVSGPKDHDGTNVGIMFKPDGLWHCSSQFIRYAEALVIVLRRPVDRYSVEKMLVRNGFRGEHNEPENRYDSRIIVAHLDGDRKGNLDYNAQCPYGMRANVARKEAVRFISRRCDYKDVVAISTKPSVNQAINQIKKYL